jgi:hypothetical protein
MYAVMLSLFFAVSGGESDYVGSYHMCCVACRCACQACKPCPCSGGRCPLDVLVTGSLAERATLPVAGLRMRRIACPDVAKGVEDE